jgi:hypothetical protein
VKGILKRLAKWIVKHGADELEKELEKQRSGAPETGRDAGPDFR